MIVFRHLSHLWNKSLLIKQNLRLCWCVGLSKMRLQFFEVRDEHLVKMLKVIQECLWQTYTSYTHVFTVSFCRNYGWFQSIWRLGGCSEIDSSWNPGSPAYHIYRVYPFLYGGDDVTWIIGCRKKGTGASRILISEGFWTFISHEQYKSEQMCKINIFVFFWWIRDL